MQLAKGKKFRLIDTLEIKEGGILVQIDQGTVVICNSTFGYGSGSFCIAPANPNPMLFIAKPELVLEEIT